MGKIVRNIGATGTDIMEFMWSLQSSQCYQTFNEKIQINNWD